ncbi:hypothetical protein DFH06DRAFT_1377089, partial [Mycena polygramma]
DLPSVLWRQHGTFPLLASVDICIRNNAEHNLGDTIRLFATAPCVQTVKITGSYAASSGWVSAFSWSGLTVLDLQIYLDLKTGRQILMQCARVQKCALIIHDSSDSDMQRPREICSLLHLNDVRFGLHCSNESSLQSFFEAFAFPSLTHLDITSHIWSTELMQGLYDRSHFSLEELMLSNIDLSMFDIVPFLRLFPALRAIHLQSYGYNVIFLAVFTCGSGTSLALPHLRSIIFDDQEFDPAEVLVSGPAVLSLAESLSQRTGENTAFPALEHVELTFNAPSFDPAIAERIWEIFRASSILFCTHNELG